MVNLGTALLLDLEKPPYLVLTQCLGSRFQPDVLSTPRCTQGGYLSYSALLLDVEELGTTRRQ